jgi:two-component system, NarL family, response regulator DesR
MESGVSGFIVKDSPADKLAQTIRKVLDGQRVIDPDLAAAALAEGTSPLTPREADVLAHAADGATIAQIAGTLYLSEGTVRNYLSSCIQKTGARNRAEALRIARERGWLLALSPCHHHLGCIGDNARLPPLPPYSRCSGHLYR